MTGSKNNSQSIIKKVNMDQLYFYLEQDERIEGGDEACQQVRFSSDDYHWFNIDSFVGSCLKDHPDLLMIRRKITTSVELIMRRQREILTPHDESIGEAIKQRDLYLKHVYPANEEQTPVDDEIQYETKDFWVSKQEFGTGQFKPKTHGFAVWHNGPTHATLVASIGYSGEKGLKLAKSEVDRRQQLLTPKGNT